MDAWPCRGTPAHFAPSEPAETAARFCVNNGHSGASAGSGRQRVIRSGGKGSDGATLPSRTFRMGSNASAASTSSFLTSINALRFRRH